MIAVAFMGSTLITPLYVLYRRELGFSEITLTLIYAVYVVGNLAALLLFGRVSDQIGRRRAAVPAMVALGISVGLFLLAGSMGWLYWARILSGFGNGIASGTGTAWLAELYGSKDRTHATLIATCANFVGVAIGPLLAGTLAQYAPLPLQLPFIAYLLLLVAVTICIGRTRETVEHPVTQFSQISIRPRIGVPASIRNQFIAPALTAFGSFALGGFYFALLPSILSQDLGQENLAVGGAIVFELSIVATVTMIVTRKLKSRISMLGGLALLLPGLALLVLAQSLRSMPILLVGTALAGVAIALGYRGSLQVVNEIAPADQRSEVVSSYFAACFIGNSVPVIGVGVLTTLANSVVASITFACTIGAFAIAAFIAGVNFYGLRPVPSRQERSIGSKLR